MKENARKNAFILNLTDEEAEKLILLAKMNDHATSTQAYLIIRNYLKSLTIKQTEATDKNGNLILNI